jgi:hypothetical protein
MSEGDTLAAYRAAAAPPAGARRASAAWAAADLHAAVLQHGLTTIAWDLVIAAVEALVWVLPGAERAAALGDVASARARLPAPAWRGELAVAAAARVRAFVLEPSREPAADLVADIDGVPGADARLTLLLELWPALAEPTRTEALRRALDAAFVVPDEVHAGQAVAAVLLRDPDAILSEALTRARIDWAELDGRWALREELARKLPEPHRAALDRDLPPDVGDVIVPRARRPVVVPPAGVTSPTEALRLWTNVALALADDAEAAAITRAAVKFLVDSAMLYTHLSRG